MSYNPDYFKNTRPSEHLLESAKASLDALGNYDHLKKDLEKAMFDGEPQKTVSVDPLAFLKTKGKDADHLC
jgi:hypothetical protein